MPPKNSSGILLQLRHLMKNKSNLAHPINAYIIPSEDAHQSEYVSNSDNRRAFISGFTGSAGTAVVTETKAALWTDARYYLQAGAELDDNWILMKQGESSTPSEIDWLKTELECGSLVGADPYLVEAFRWKSFADELTQGGHSLVPVEKNFVDEVWQDRPPRLTNPIASLAVEFAGTSVSNKIETLREKFKDSRVIAIVITALDEVAYLFNLRGSDIDYNPVFFSYALITLDEAFLFVDDNNLTDEAKKVLKLGRIEVKVLPYADLSATISKVLSENEGKLFMPCGRTGVSWAVSEMVPKERRVSQPSLVAIMKAVKNDTEKIGMRESHLRDGAALCRYLSWLEGEAEKGTQTEISGATKLEEFRKSQSHFVGLSFPTISSVGPNAAIIHYNPTPETDREITLEEIYLCDSGAQYKDGTTDVTRTLHFGIPSSFEKDCFTRVLKGHIALAKAIFPSKTKGNRLDTIARQSLWEAGLDYGHGTGHGIGMYLNVHEGPMGISFRENKTDPGLVQGMFLSNEPGYYEDGKFGIRIESIVEVIKAETPHNFGGKDFLTFKTITLAPIQTKLIAPKMLTAGEIEWLNIYHSEVRERVGAVILEQGDKNAYDWLLKETQPIG